LFGDVANFFIRLQQWPDAADARTLLDSANNACHLNSMRMGCHFGSLQGLIVHNIKNVKQFAASKEGDGEEWDHIPSESRIFFQECQKFGELFNRSIERRGRQPANVTAAIPQNATKGPLDKCFRRVEKCRKRPCFRRVRIGVRSLSRVTTVFAQYCRIEDTHSFLETCSYWHADLIQQHRIWEHYLCQKFPNLKLVPADALPIGRVGFIKRLWMMANAEFCPVRPTMLPRPLIPVTAIAAHLPTSITFLLDLVYEGVSLISATHVYKLGSKGEITSCAGWTPDDDGNDLGAVELLLDEEAHETIMMAEQLWGLVEECGDGPLSGCWPLGPSKVAAHLLLSYYCEYKDPPGAKNNKLGQNRSKYMPRTGPAVVLLSEPAPFFVCSDKLSSPELREPTSIVFRTDTTHSWVEAGSNQV
jgi:hypothetical protein